MNSKFLSRTQILQCDLDYAWQFFSTPENLDMLTPDDMKFEILTPKPIPTIYEGQIIEYKVRPLLNIPMYWKTEIRKVEQKKYFTDVQLKGPYRVWIHTHKFEQIGNNQVLMTDELEYSVGYGLLGELATRFFVENKIEQIFNFRYKKVDSIFNEKN